MSFNKLSNKKKMAIISSTDFKSWPIGGILSFLQDLIPYLDHYFKVEIWGVKTKRDAGARGIIIDGKYFNIFYFAKIKPDKKRIVPNVLKVVVSIFLKRRKINLRNYDVIYFHGLPLEIPFIFSRRKYFLFSHIHGLAPLSSSYPGFKGNFLFEKIYNWLRSVIIKRSDITFISADKKTFNEFVRNFSEEINKKIVRIPNCADPKIFRPRGKVISRKKLNLPIDVKIIIFAGRITYIKDPFLAIYAFQEFLSNFDYNSLLLFLGEGELLNECQKIVKKLKIEKKVLFLGRKQRDELAEYLSASDVFILTSKAEGIPIVLIEALMSGLPVVSTEISGIKDLVKDGYNGFIVKERKPKAIAHKIWEVLDGRAERMGNNSLVIVKDLTPRKIAEILKEKVEFLAT